jgi:hypothetical protein
VSLPPLWSSGQNSWLQIQRSWFNSRRYQIFWQVVGIEQGPLSLVSTIDDLLGRKSSVSGLENREYGRRNPSLWPRETLYQQTLVLTSPTSGRSVGIVCSWTEATELLLLLLLLAGIPGKIQIDYFPYTNPECPHLAARVDHNTQNLT